MAKSNTSKTVTRLAILVAAVILCIGAPLFLYHLMYKGGAPAERLLTYAELSSRISNKEVKRAEVTEARITGSLISGERFRTDLSNPTLEAQLGEDLRSSGASVVFVGSGNGSFIGWLKGSAQRTVPAALLLAAFVLLPAFWVWMIVDCAVKEPPGPDKIVWILIILLGNAIGAAIYFVVRRSGRGHGPISATG